MNRTRSKTSDGVRSDDTSTRHWFLPPLNPLLDPKVVTKPCYKISPFTYERRACKTRAMQGFHDVHRYLFSSSKQMGTVRIRRQMKDLLGDYPRLLKALGRCSVETPCGLSACPYCSACVAIRNATLLATQFDNPIAFTLMLDPMTEEQFATQVTVGKVTEKGRTMDNLADHRWANKNFSTRIRKHTKDARIVMMPDVDWDPRTRTIKPHYHCVIDESERWALDKLRQMYPGRVVYSAPVEDDLRYLNYGQKTPLLRWKHLKEVHHVKEDQGDDLNHMIRALNRLLILWKMMRPPVLLLGFADRDFAGKIRSSEFALTTALSWRPSTV